MNTSRTYNALRNIVWGVVGRISAILMPFFTRTVLIKVLGAEYLGLDSLFISILQVLSISELGFGAAIVFSMYKPIAENNKREICALLNVYRKIYHVIGAIILMGGLIVAPFLKRIISGDCPEDVNIYILYLIYLLNTVVSYFLFAYKAAIFSAHQRNDLTSKCTLIVMVLSNLLQIASILTLQNYYAYVIIVPLATILTNLLNAYLAHKLFPDLVCKGSISREDKESLRKRVVGLLSYKIYGTILSSVDAVVISAFLGLVPLAVFNNYHYLQVAVTSFLSILSVSITAGIGNKMIHDSIEDNYQLFKKLVFARGWICSWCSICMLCLYQHFMHLWVGDELMFSFETMSIFVLHFLFSQMTSMTYVYKEAAGLWWEDRFRPLVAAVVNLGLNIILVQHIGINGVILSTLVCTVFINIPWGSYVLFKYYFRRSMFEYLRKIVYYIVVTIIIGMVTLFICEFMPSKGYIAFIGKLVICCILPNVLLWITYHRQTEYAYIRQLAVRIIKRIK